MIGRRSLASALAFRSEGVMVVDRRGPSEWREVTARSPSRSRVLPVAIASHALGKCKKSIPGGGRGSDHCDLAEDVNELVFEAFMMSGAS
jgi:hypothetical protein